MTRVRFGTSVKVFDEAGLKEHRFRQWEWSDARRVTSSEANEVRVRGSRVGPEPRLVLQSFQYTC